MSDMMEIMPRLYTPLGGDLDAYPGMSSFGQLLRGARISGLLSSQFHDVLGVSFAYNAQIFRLITFSPSKLKTLATVFQLDDGAVKMWDVKTWWPFEGSVPVDLLTWELRICKACARSCYHTLLFQMPGVTHCPWHGIALINRCDCCERPLLAGFAKGLALLSCPCGRDFVNNEETITGEISVLSSKGRIVNAYLAWAETSRSSNWLFAPEASDVMGWHALDELVTELGLPSYISKYNAAASHRETVIVDRPNRSVKNICPDNWLPFGSGLDKEHATLVLLPKLVARPLDKIGFAILEELSLLPTSPTTAKGAGRPKTKHAKKKSAARHSPILPIYPLGDWAFFDTGSLQRDNRRVITRLCWLIDTRLHPNRKTPELEGFMKLKTAIQDFPARSKVVGSTVLRLLHRGYCDGLRVSIGRHVPEIYDSSTLRPRNQLPWINLKYDELGPRGAAIAWTRQRNTE